MYTTIAIMASIVAYLAIVLGSGWLVTASWPAIFGVAVCLAATSYAVYWAAKRYKL